MLSNSFAELTKKSGLSKAAIAELVGYSPRTVHRWFKDEAKPRESALRLLESIVQQKEKMSEKPAFTFIDLFAGIGGLRLGFESISGKCIYTSEWNDFAQKTYRANFPDEEEIAGDITRIHESEIPAHDVLLAGFPCQPFSIAGVSKKNSLKKPHGFSCDIQGTLFFDVARIIKRHRPKAFLLENVKNLISHDKGRTFRVIHDVLAKDLNYQISYKVIDARSWVPQHRERIFIVGFRESNDFSFDDFYIPSAEDAPKLNSILHPEDGTECLENNERFLDSEGKVIEKYTLTDHLWKYLQEYALKHRARGNGFGYSVFGKEDVARTLSARYYKDGSEVLIHQENKNPRRLTPRECSRLMGFDKPGGSSFTIPVSDTQAYKQFGNAVVVPVVKAIANHMHPFIIATEKPLERQEISIG